MSERIKELKIQAYKWASENAPTHEYENYADQKFSELIIEEVIQIIKNTPNGYRDYRNQIEDDFREHCIVLLKDKFGVDQ